MKVLAILLLCAFAAVQGRSAVQVVDNSSSEIAQAIKPWVTHLRYAVRTSGLLETGAGSLISRRWVLTDISINASSFIWIRLGVENVIQPGLVIESTVLQLRGYLVLLNLNRDVEFTASIAPISLVASSGAVSGESCGFGLSVVGGPGENLQCSRIDVEESEEGKLIGASGKLTQFDLGTGLVSDDELSAVLIAVEDETATYEKLDQDLLNWISEVTGLEVGAPSPKPDSSESESKSSESESKSSERDSDSSESKEESRVKFVNF